MKNQALFSSKDKSKKLKCRPLQFLFGALRVNMELLVLLLYILHKLYLAKIRSIHISYQNPR